VGSVPTVSVIIPAYNAAAYLPETLDSIFAQSYRDFEIILVDDGSTDDTGGVVARYGDRIDYVRQANSGGPARPRNVAIARARGRYICIFDSDDLMLPEKLERSVAFLDAQPDLGLVFTDFVKFDTRGTHPGTHMQAYTNFHKLPKVQVGPARFRIGSTVAFESLFYGNYIGTSGVLAPAAVLKDIGPFDESVTRGGLEDRDMWFRIARERDIGYLDFVGHRYRVLPGSVSRRAAQSAEARIEVIRRHARSLRSARARRQARAVVAECHFDIAAHHWRAGDLASARRHLRQSLLERPSASALQWLALSLLGARSLALWRRLRGRA